MLFNLSQAVVAYCASTARINGTKHPSKSPLLQLSHGSEITHLHDISKRSIIIHKVKSGHVLKRPQTMMTVH